MAARDMGPYYKGIDGYYVAIHTIIKNMAKLKPKLRQDPNYNSPCSKCNLASKGVLMREALTKAVEARNHHGNLGMFNTMPFTDTHETIKT